MAKRADKTARHESLPVNPQRVILVNPTKYLGNLLLAGGLMQSYADYCHQQGIRLKIVIDESFRELCESSFPPHTLIYFPRQKISRSGFLKKILLYWRCLKQIRSFKADLAFNIEEDSATNHLTRFSSARFKLGCSPRRHSRGYNHVIPIRFENREPASAHRWYSFYEVFALLGMPEPEKSYLDLSLGNFSETLNEKLQRSGWDARVNSIALHAGATKAYKKWPLEHMASLIKDLLQAGLQPVLLGAGNQDCEANQKIVALLEKDNSKSQVVDLCNQLSLVELAQFLKQCSIMVGNDSGPFHLGSALGIHGLVLWGPTNKSIWGPLGEHSKVITGSFTCDPACSKGNCLHQHRCLYEITPPQVFNEVMEKLSNQGQQEHVDD